MIDFPDAHPISGPLRVLLAHDDHLFRFAMRTILIERLNAAEVIEVGSLDEAIEVLGADDPPQFAVLDLAMPGMRSPSSLGAVREMVPQLRVAVISSSRRRQDVIDALQAGVHGFLPKSYSVEQLTNALRLVLEGLIFVPSSVAIHAAALPPEGADRRREPRIDIPQPTILTPRQWDVLELLVQGQSNKEIARTLELGEGTVKIHLAALFRNLKVRNRAAAAVAGHDLLMLRPEPDLAAIGS
ncbi:LuxR C-terminal-related transcriptional regulator [Halodurantibacterium flavum]|uniref:LuxR C-terminal-related transcriptional regulator n=1 Tax=Halodurantibacterium flavum TaxID=1382802 RepID=A0ABW4S6M9_9RHOB